MRDLENIYGIKVDNCDLFKKALTHPSFTKEQELPYIENYERLEFLGDAVLKLVTSELLYQKYPHYSEGDLSKIRSIVVSDNTLSKIAHNIGLCNLIIAAKHELKQGVTNMESVCACAFEAVLGAFYLDGKLLEIKEFLRTVLMSYIEEVDGNFEKYNAKALLQEYTQSIDKKIPNYRLIQEAGPAHNKTFTVEVEYHETVAHGTGKTKKEAEQQAAYEACKIFGVIQ